MDYIVLDMEWNQPWPGSPSAKKVLPVQIRGEILQIGAVRVTEDQQVADEFQVLIKPKYYRRLNRRVSKLTGIKESQLRERLRGWACRNSGREIGDFVASAAGHYRRRRNFAEARLSGIPEEKRVLREAGE